MPARRKVDDPTAENVTTQLTARRLRVFKQYRRGYSLPILVGEPELSVETIMNDLLSIIELSSDITPDMRRVIEDLRLDMALAAISMDLENGDMKAVELFLKLHDRRVKLWGLVSPGASVGQGAVTVEYVNPEEMVYEG
jgi:hypothetical protein